MIYVPILPQISFLFTWNLSNTMYKTPLDGMNHRAFGEELSQYLRRTDQPLGLCSVCFTAA